MKVSTVAAPVLSCRRGGLIPTLDYSYGLREGGLGHIIRLGSS